LCTIAKQSFRLPLFRILSWRNRTVEKMLSIGLVVRICTSRRGGQNLLGAVSDNLGQSIAGEETWQFYVFGHTITDGGVLLKKDKRHPLGYAAFFTPSTTFNSISGRHM